MARVQDNYKAPPREREGDYKLGWVREAIEQGTSFVKSTRAAVDMEQAVDIISGFADERIPDGRSRIQFNKLKRQIREIVAVSSTLRPIEGFGSDNPEMRGNSYVLNKLWRAWWDNTFVSRSVREAKQWAAVTGTGYLSPVYHNDFWTVGRGDIALETYGAGNVLPVQIPRNGDHQKAYAVTIHSEMPLAMAHALYPLYSEKISADRTQPGFFKRMTDRFLRSQSPVLRLQERKGKSYPFPICDIYYTYIMDMTANTSGETVRMGDPGTSWSYDVPSYGSDIKVGVDGKGRDVIRKATLEDAMLYPLRRLMISFTNCVVYDDTSKWWHGKVPLVKFTVDDWPWEPLAFPLTKDGAGLQSSIVRLMRHIEENAVVRMDPPLQYGSGIAKTLMETLDLRSPGQRIQNDDMDTGAGKISAILDPMYYDIPQWIPQHIEKMSDMMDYLMATRDMTAIARAAQIPSSDSIEKLWEMAGPITQDITTGDEKAICELAAMWKPLAFQFYTTARTMQILGTDGYTKEQFDFQPGNMVPSHLPGEDRGNPSKFTQIERAKYQSNNYFYQITRGSAYQQTNMSRKLFYAQLVKLGMPIDWWTLAEVFEVAAFGNPPQGSTSVMERWIAQQFLQGELQQELQKMLAAPGSPEEALKMAQDFLNKTFNRAQEGRPPEFKGVPTIANKPTEFRSTITGS